MQHNRNMNCFKKVKDGKIHKLNHESCDAVYNDKVDIMIQCSVVNSNNKKTVNACPVCFPDQ